jgi:transposase-like protein
MTTPCSTRNPLFLRWFQDEVIIVAVRWYLTYPLSYRQVCDMLRDRGVCGCEHLFVDKTISSCEISNF